MVLWLLSICTEGRDFSKGLKIPGNWFLKTHSTWHKPVFPPYKEGRNPGNDKWTWVIYTTLIWSQSECPPAIKQLPSHLALLACATLKSFPEKLKKKTTLTLVILRGPLSWVQVLRDQDFLLAGSYFPLIFRLTARWLKPTQTSYFSES